VEADARQGELVLAETFLICCLKPLVSKIQFLHMPACIGVEKEAGTKGRWRPHHDVSQRSQQSSQPGLAKNSFLSRALVQCGSD
jgi:hypothetical protein